MNPPQQVPNQEDAISACNVLIDYLLENDIEGCAKRWLDILNDMRSAIQDQPK